MITLYSMSPGLLDFDSICELTKNSHHARKSWTLEQGTR